MKPRLAILAALPREVAPLVRDWPICDASQQEGATVWECDSAVVVCAGMGRRRVSRALDLAESLGPLHSVISVGYAGALHVGMALDAVYWPAAVIDAQTGERFGCKGGSGTLVTIDHVADHREKFNLAVRWNADLVDMEAAAVARLAQIHELPFQTLRAVSDEAADKLPDLDRFTNQQGGFREASFALYVALHPWLVPTAIKLGKQAERASQRITQALHHVLEQAE